MSLSEQIGPGRPSAGDAVVESPGAGCLEPGSVHLLMADTALDEQHRCRVYLALCGAELAADSLPPWECPLGCTCADRLICAHCVRRAAQWSDR